jgi:hypothetical protein
MSVLVRDVIMPAAAAVGKSRRDFLKALSVSVRPTGSGDSDPSRETILGYDKAPETRCGYKFAGMVLDCLYANRAAIKPGARALISARKACRAVLSEFQKARFQRLPVTNPASANRVAEIAGVYVLVRRATSDHNLRQELLVLSQEADSEHATFVTYVNPEVVCRGMWSIIRDTVSCMTNGYRANWRPDVVNFHLLYEEPSSEGNPVFLSGFATGVTSQTALPAVVPVVAVRLLDNKSAGAEIWRIGNGGDAEIRTAWSTVCKKTPADFEKLGQLMDEAMAPRDGTLVRRERELSSRIVQTFGGLEAVVSDEVVKFCKTYKPDAWWNPPKIRISRR